MMLLTSLPSKIIFCLLGSESNLLQFLIAGESAIDVGAPKHYLIL